MPTITFTYTVSDAHITKAKAALKHAEWTNAQLGAELKPLIGKWLTEYIKGLEENNTVETARQGVTGITVS